MKKVLIIDDDLAIRLILKKILSNFIHSVDLTIFTSSDGVEGLGYAYVSKPDLIIIDTTLPKYSGRELIEYLKTNENFATTAIILLNEEEQKFEDLPQNYVQVSKKDKNFPQNLINLTIEKLDYLQIESNLNENRSFRITNALASRVLGRLNKSNIISHRINSSNIFTGIISSIRYFAYQLESSIYLTAFFIVAGRKDKEESVEQKNSDLAVFRSKMYPALGFMLATLFVCFIQIVLVVGGLFSINFVGNKIVNAASYTWDGGGLTNNWSDCDNWSTNICPVAADSLTFNGTSTKDSTIDASWGGTITNLTLASGYTGTITQERSLIISTGFAQSDGTFTAGSQTITVQTGSFTLNTGGTFNASSATSIFNSTFTINGGTFNHNNGVVNFTGGSATLSCNNIVFNLVSFTGQTNTKTVNGNCSLPLGNSPIIPSSIALSGALSGSGTISSTAGTLTFNSGSVFSGFTGFTTTVGNFTVAGGSMDFSGLTTFVGGTVTLSSGSLTLPNGADVNSGLVISGGIFNAPSGNMTVAGNLTISGSPTFNHNNGTITFDGGSATLSCNNVVFNLVALTHTTGGKTVNSNCSLPLGNNPTTISTVVLNGGTLSGTGLFTMNGSGTTAFSGTLTGFSDVLFGNSITLSIGGTLNLSAFSTATIGIFSLGATGTFTAAPSTTIRRDFTIASGGVFNHNSGTLYFEGTSSQTGTLSCNNATFNLVVLNNAAVKTVNSDCNLPLGNNPTISNGVTLNGTLTGTGTITNTTGTLRLNTGAVLSGFTGLTGTSNALTIIGATFNASNYSPMNVNGTFTFSSGTFTAPSGIMTMSGAVVISGGTFNHNNGTINFGGTTNVSIACNNLSFNLVTLTNTAGTKTIGADCNLPLGNNPTILNGATLNGTLSGTGTITTTALTLNTGAVLSGFGGYTAAGLTVAGANIDMSGYTTFTTSTGIVTLSSGSLSLPSGADLNQSLVISGGTFTAPSGTMTVASTFTVSGAGVFNHNNGTLVFDGAGGTLTCNNVTFNLVRIENTSGTKTIQSSCSFPMGANPVITRGPTLNGVISGTGVLTISTSTLIMNAGSSLAGFSGINSSLLTIAGATADFSGYSSYTTSNTNLSSGSLSLPPSADINGTLTISGGTFTASSGTLTVAGDTTISGSPTFNHNNGTISFDGSGQDLSCNNVTFNNIQLPGSVTTVSSNCTFNLGNNPTIGLTIILHGTFTGTGLLTTGGTFSLHEGGVLSGFSGLTSNGLSIATGVRDLSIFDEIYLNGLTIGSTATLIAPAVITLAWMNNANGGTFDHNDGTVIFNGTGTSRSIRGSTTFNNLEIHSNAQNPVEFVAGTTTTVSGSFIAKGTESQILQLRTYTDPDLIWNLDPKGSVDIEYVDVRGSNNIGSPIQAFGKNITDSGNNTGWNFDAPIISSFGPSNLSSGGYTNSNTPTFNFNIVDPNGDLVKYNIQIDENSDFSSPVIDHTSDFEEGGDKSYTTTLLYDGTYYLRIKGLDSSGGDSGYTNINNGEIAFRIDSIAPTGGILVTDDSSNTNDVLLILSSSDVGSGVSEMIISENESFSGASYEAYATSKKYTLSNTSATVYVKYKDGAGNESQIYSAALEQTNTSIPISYPEDGTVAEGLAVVAFRLVDRNNNPIANIPIKLVELGVETTTDENGVAIFENIPLGKYSILGVYNEKEFTQEIEVTSEDKVITIKLEESPNSLTYIFGIVAVIFIIVSVSSVGYIVMKQQKKKWKKTKVTEKY